MERFKIKRIVSGIGLLAIIAMIILPALQTMAADPEPYTVLAPLPGTTLTDCPPGSTDCKTTLQKYLPGLFNLLIGLAAVAAVLNIVIGGFQYMSTDAIQGKSAGKERIKNAIFSLVLIISAYLILWTVNPALLTLNLNITPAITTAPAVTVGTVGALGVKMTDEQIAASNAVRAFLLLSKVYVYRDPCTEGQTTQCVNLNGINSVVMSDLVKLSGTLSCSQSNPCVTITGGTEAGHSAGSDHNDGTAVDLRLDPKLTAYVIKNGGTPTPSANGPIFTVKINGADTHFLLESDHWHISFIPQ